MAVVFETPKALTDAVLHYCPGCPHGIIHRLVAEAIDELGIEGSCLVITTFAKWMSPVPILNGLLILQ